MGHKSIKERDNKVISLMDKGIKKIALNQGKSPTTVMAKLEMPQSPKVEKNNPQPLPKAFSTGDWGIQIGAFRNYAKARSYALELKKQIPEIKTFPIDIETVSGEMSVLYRSKITNFSQEDAQEICNRLKNENRSCIVVKTEEKSQLDLAQK